MYGLASTESTVTSAPVSAVASASAPARSRCSAARAVSVPEELKSRPEATFMPAAVLTRAVNADGSASGPASRVTLRSAYSAETNAIRSRSRSTISRVATDCTRPADSFGLTFFHSTGLTS